MEMYFGYSPVQQQNYIREHNYDKICGICLFCCELNFYRNGTYYLQEFICCFF